MGLSCVNRINLYHCHVSTQNGNSYCKGKMNCNVFTFRRGFGGKFGALVTEHFKAEFMGDLVQYTQQQLMSALGEKSG